MLKAMVAGLVINNIAFWAFVVAMGLGWLDFRGYPAGVTLLPIFGWVAVNITLIMVGAKWKHINSSA